MPVYLFKIDNDRSTQEGYVVSSSQWKAKELIAKKSDVAEEQIVHLERVCDRLEDSSSLASASAYKLISPFHEKFYNQLKNEEYTIFSSFQKLDIEDTILEDDDVHEEDFRFLY